MPTENEVLDRIRSIVAEHYDIDESTIERDCHFYTDLGSDTFTFMEFIVKVEDEFEMSIPEVEAKRIETVGALVKFVVQRRR